MSLRDRLEAGFVASFGDAPAIVARAPGRVNLIGEHTDYNDGYAMPLAIGQETQVAFRPGGPDLQVAALDLGETDTFQPCEVRRSKPGSWRNYVRGIVHELARAGIVVPGGRLAIAGSVVLGTGLSSSASLEVAIAGALLAAAGAEWDALSIALAAQRAECDFAGVRCGNLDQIAAAATRRDHALLIDCRSLACEQIPMPEDIVVMIVQSGVTRGLVEGHYNERRQQCERAALALGVAALRDASEADLARARDVLDPVVYRRARHVVTDNRRTLEAAKALRLGDLAHVGVLMRESHLSQARDFEITVPETDQLAGLMNAAIGSAGGARQTGGGFGGAVIGLMRRDCADEVRTLIGRTYRTPGGAVPAISVETASAGLSVENLGSAPAAKVTT